MSRPRSASRRAWLAAAAALALAACQSTPVAPPPPPPEPPPPPPPPRPAPRPPRLGLALGGGAARGFAHIGVIQVLEEAAHHTYLVLPLDRPEIDRFAVPS